MMFEQKSIVDNKYKILKVIGEGGFGKVYLASDTLIKNRLVAIKVLKGQDEKAQEQLISEMQFLSDLDHPNIVKFYHHFFVDNTLCLVMEYCSGGSLRDQIQNAPNEVMIFNWISKIADIMQWIHDKGISHHDIKPDNILFTKSGEIKISDFGVANSNWGTGGYLPLEWFTGNIRDINDYRIDIFSLGITTLEILIGSNPLFGLKQNEIFQKRISQSFVPGDLKHWIQEIILKATHPTPELRFQTMNEFKEAVSARKVPQIIDSRKIEAAKMVQKSEYFFKRKKYTKVKTLVELALNLNPDCVSALQMAGKLSLIRNDINTAEKHFNNAIIHNPRVNIQKELSIISIKKKHYSRALSLLNDYLYRQGADLEAYNLLLKVYYETERYEIGIELADSVMKVYGMNNCIANNRFLCQVMHDSIIHKKTVIPKSKNIFLKYNANILKEFIKNGESLLGLSLKSKMIFHDYFFDNYLRKGRINTVEINKQGEYFDITWNPIITIGRLESNDIVLNDPSVSRKHCVIFSFNKNVWLYDINSTLGTYLDGNLVEDITYLEYLHEVLIGNVKIKIHLPEFFGKSDKITIAIQP